MKAYFDVEEGEFGWQGVPIVVVKLNTKLLSWSVLIVVYP